MEGGENHEFNDRNPENGKKCLQERNQKRSGTLVLCTKVKKLT
jgi:hypothetical protein